MSIYFKPLSFFLLLVLILLSVGNHAQPMKMVSATVHQFQTPVLKGNETNPVIQIKIETEGKKNPITLHEVKVDLSGIDIQNDIEKVDIFYTEENHFLEDGNRFGIAEKPQKQIIFPGNQKLIEGINIFWVSVQLKEKANILNEIKVGCSSLKLNNQTIIPENASPLVAQKFGIALRKHNDDGVHTYRIPGLETTNNGTLIAVYDVRRNGEVDLQEDIDVGMNRSTDGGKTWEPMKIIIDMGEWGGLPNRENGVGDPSILIDRQTGTIWVAALWTHGKPDKRAWISSNPGLSEAETGQMLLVKSDDDGKTWSDPINITEQVKNKKWQLLLQGPGKGISMKNGTLIFPAQYKDENQIPHSTIITSSDNGTTWKIGNGAKPETTEAQVIELNDGSLMLNMRDNGNNRNKSETNGRAIMVSNDLGQTWFNHPTSNGALPEPVCMASLIKEKFEVNGKLHDLVVFSNPNSKNQRQNMTIKISFDDGKSWPSEFHFLIDEMVGRGYSCLTKIDDRNLGILYESSQADLAFQIIPIDKIIQQNKNLKSIFISGTEGYSTFRIPAMVTTNSGKILAFAEGRVNGSSDTGNIDMVMRSSEDGGKTWSPLKIIWNDGENVCGNPAPVVDRETGKIHLLMTWNLGEDHERDIIDEKSKDTRRVLVVSSIDEGENWTTPKEITPSVKLKNWTWYATGPCHGIQLKYGGNKGRLVIPCDHIEAGTKKYYSHIIYSDDYGKTWNLGGTTPQDQVNECTVAELPGGKLILNMRNYDRTQKSRKISFSDDGGLNWSANQPDTALIEPICQASMLFTEENETLWFLNPASENSRTNMTLKSSKDLGKTWKTEKTLYSGASAYSDLTLINSNTLGCLFEGGLFNPYEGIVFTTFEKK
jgi:sialidase-1